MLLDKATRTCHISVPKFPEKFKFSGNAQPMRNSVNESRGRRHLSVTTNSESNQGTCAPWGLYPPWPGTMLQSQAKLWESIFSPFSLSSASPINRVATNTRIMELENSRKDPTKLLYPVAMILLISQIPFITDNHWTLRAGGRKRVTIHSANVAPQTKHLIFRSGSDKHSNSYTSLLNLKGTHLFSLVHCFNNKHPSVKSAE